MSNIIRPSFIRGDCKPAAPNSDHKADVVILQVKRCEPRPSIVMIEQILRTRHKGKGSMAARNKRALDRLREIFKHPA